MVTDIDLIQQTLKILSNSSEVDLNESKLLRDLSAKLKNFSQNEINIIENKIKAEREKLQVSLIKTSKICPTCKRAL